MDEQFTIRVMTNDLDSMAIRIEALSAHPDFTNAGDLVRKARDLLMSGASEIHQRDMQERFAKNRR